MCEGGVWPLSAAGRLLCNDRTGMPLLGCLLLKAVFQQRFVEGNGSSVVAIDDFIRAKISRNDDNIEIILIIAAFGLLQGAYQDLLSDATHQITSYSHGSFRPVGMEVQEYFARLLQIGVTQHYGLAAGDWIRELRDLAKLMGFSFQYLNEG